MNTHESTADFKERLAIEVRRLRGEGIYSILGAPRSPEWCRKPVQDCTAAVESGMTDAEIEDRLIEMGVWTR